MSIRLKNLVLKYLTKNRSLRNQVGLVTAGVSDGIAKVFGLLETSIKDLNYPCME
jgi:hypothetical protein